MAHRLILFLAVSGLVLGLLLPTQAINAQAQQASETPGTRFRFEHFRTSDGLPVDFLFKNALLQDQQGFLWIGSLVGLARYDGYSFTNLPLGGVFALVEDHEGMIWVGTDDGLSRFNPVTGTFTEYQHNASDATSLSSGNVRALYIDRAGTLWVGAGSGLDRFDQATETFIHFQHDPENPNSLSPGPIQAIYEDREGVLWVGAASGNVRIGGIGGLSRFDPDTKTFKRYQHDPGDVHTLIDDRTYIITEDRQGTLYVGTCESGLHRYDRMQDRFERLIADPRNPGHLFAPKRTLENISCPSVSIIHEDAKGGFWVGTNGVGLNYFSPDRSTVTRYTHDPSDPHSLSGDQVSSFHEDRQGVLWVGTNNGGLNKIIPSPEQWFQSLVFDAANPDRSPEVTSVMEDRAGRFWMGTRGGAVYQYDPAEDAVLALPIRLPVNVINSIYEDHLGLIWMGTNSGLHRWDPQTEVLKDYLGEVLTSLVTSIHEDAEGMLWIGTWSNGLYRLDPSTDIFTNYQHDANDVSSLGGVTVYSMYEDQQGTLWIGTLGKRTLSRYDREQDRFTTILEGTPAVLLEDTQGRFWFGTYGRGLFQYDRTTGATTAFTVKDGLPNNIVGGIAEDDQGFLWLSTPGGLVRFDPVSTSFVTFTEADGFPNTMNDPEADELIKSRNGKILVGGNKGLTVISPDQVIFNPHPPEVIVTGLQVFDEPLQDEGRLSSALVLAHEHNDLTFDYVGLHFVRPEKNRYEYQLVGYDEAFRQAGPERTARYTNLDPGTYTFRVKASNSDGVWSDEEASVNVTIEPPWWQTIWAYVLYGLLLIAGVVAADRIQRRRLLRKERERMRERELEQARQIEKAHAELQQSHQHLKATQVQLIQSEKMASLGSLTAGIAHEIKNPLNFINNFAEVNEELADELREAHDANPDIKLADLLDVLDDLKQNAQVINKHGKRADSIVHSMMQHARSNEGHREATDVNALVEEYFNLAYHGMRAKQADFNVTLQRDYDEAVGNVEMVPQEIGRVLINLFNNAFYAVDQKATTVNGAYEPSITVKTKQLGQAVEIQISDNGQGIPNEIQKKVFEPFFTTKPTGQGNTGLGLSLSYDIVTKGHGGSLTIDSQEGKGATFVITLPV